MVEKGWLEDKLMQLGGYDRPTLYLLLSPFLSRHYASFHALLLSFFRSSKLESYRYKFDGNSVSYSGYLATRLATGHWLCIAYKSIQAGHLRGLQIKTNLLE